MTQKEKKMQPGFELEKSLKINENLLLSSFSVVVIAVF